MPYIAEELRDLFDEPIEALALSLAAVPEDKLMGCVNYVITALLAELPNGNYDSMNKIIGVLECAKLEYYRRIMAPYETRKMADHGDVYA